MLAIYLICSLFCTYCYFQNNRKRKQATSSGPANSTGTGNSVGPSTNSPPSTPSTHMPGDGLGISGNMRHVPKNLMMYGADGTGLASSSNQMVRAFSLNLTPRCINIYMIWIGNIVVVCVRMTWSNLVMWALWMITSNHSYPMMMEMLGIFLPHSKEVLQSLTQPLRKVMSGMLLQTANSMLSLSLSHDRAPLSLGFTFSEVNCWRTSNSKVVCCHFSSDGKILASAGHEKKVSRFVVPLGVSQFMEPLMFLRLFYFIL